MSDKIKIELSTSITGLKNEQLTFIEIRKPVFREIRQFGYPFNSEGIDWPVASKCLSALSGLPEAILDQVSASDSLKMVTALGEAYGADEEDVKN